MQTAQENTQDDMLDRQVDSRIENLTGQLVTELIGLPQSSLIDALNSIRQQLHEISPFRKEPVDFVKWVSSVFTYFPIGWG